jgi:hypothetical protein
MLSLKEVAIFSNYSYGESEADTAYYGEKEGLRFAFGIINAINENLTAEELADYGKIQAYYEYFDSN